MSASGSRVAVVGGGVIGLSVAWELSNRGHEVTVVDKYSIGRKASWAGAGILAPASLVSQNPLDRLMALGSQLHSEWHRRLLQQTGIDNGYRECGGIYVARTAGERAALAGQKLFWAEHEIEFEEVDETAKAASEDCQTLGLGEAAMILQVPSESQIRNPDHLKALARACELNDVSLMQNCRELRVVDEGDGLIELVVNGKSIPADCVCVSAGAWTTGLLQAVGFHLPMIPVRGQMLLFKLERQIFSAIVNEGSRYIVPREDGHVLVGSTTEEVGFDETTTDEKLSELQAFAQSIVPDLKPERLVQSWAGLRPAANDGFPFMGKLAGFENGFVTTGHFKCGLQMAPAAAVIMADLIENKPTLMDVAPFEPSRLDDKSQFEPPANASFSQL